MTDSFGTVFSNSWKFFVAHFCAFGMSALVFGVVLFSMQKLIEMKVSTHVDQRFGSIEQLAALGERIENGDQQALQELVLQMGIIQEGEPLTEEAVQTAALAMMQKVLPLVGIFFLGLMLLLLASSTTFFVIAADKDIRSVPGLLLPMLGVWIWTFLHSFAWVPVFGVLIALYRGPRLLMSNVLLVQERTSIVQSVRQSLLRTRGHWCKIIGNGIAMSVLMVFVILGLSIAAALFALVSPVAAAILASVLQMLVTAFGTVFVVQLSNTIQQNPKG